MTEKGTNNTKIKKQTLNQRQTYRGIEMVLLEAKIQDLKDKNNKQNEMIMQLLNYVASVDQRFQDVRDERDICRQTLAKWIAMDQMEVMAETPEDIDKLSVQFLLHPSDANTKWVYINSFFKRNVYSLRAFNDDLVYVSDKEFQKFSDKKAEEKKRRRLDSWCAAMGKKKQKK